jgi:hydroxyacylglutathione hydrolase
MQIKKLVLGPFQNNSYLISSSESGECVVIDPAIGSQILIDDIRKDNLKLSQIWITHAHFDHIAGVQKIVNDFGHAIPIYIHPLELQLWEEGGGAKELGIEIDLNPAKTIPLSDNQVINLGKDHFKILHTPGHTSGHVVFYCAQENVAFCGDLIFRNSIGRTDLKGGNYEQILTSIKTRIFTMPDETRLLSGHGPETTVGQEKKENPFL